MSSFKNKLVKTALNLQLFASSVAPMVVPAAKTVATGLVAIETAAVTAPVAATTAVAFGSSALVTTGLIAGGTALVVTESGCGSKSSDPVPVKPGTGTGGTGTGGTGTGGTGTGGTGTGGTGTTVDVPTIILQYTTTNNSKQDAAGNIVSGKFLTEDPTTGTQSTVLFYGTGGTVKGELKNVTGTLTNEGDGYAYTYYPKNVFKLGDRKPTVSDTSTYAAMKFTSFDATGHETRKFLFMYNATGAGEGGLALTSPKAVTPMTDGSNLSAIYKKTNYVVR